MNIDLKEGDIVITSQNKIATLLKLPNQICIIVFNKGEDKKKLVPIKVVPSDILEEELQEIISNIAFEYIDKEIETYISNTAEIEINGKVIQVSVLNLKKPEFIKVKTFLSEGEQYFRFSLIDAKALTDMFFKYNIKFIILNG